MSTPGRAYALRRLAAARRTNRAKAAAGKSVTIGGKKVSAKTYKSRYGGGKPGKRQKGHTGKFASYSNTQLRKMSGARKGKKRSTTKRKRSRR